MKLTIDVELDAHDDIYYKVSCDNQIIADRVYGYENVMLLVGAKLKTAFGRGG